MEGTCEETNTSLDPTPRSMEQELADLTSQFKGQCKVLDAAKGNFVKTVKLHPENLDIVFNFKLTGSYPTTPAVVEIRTEALDEDEIEDLQVYMALLPVEVRLCGMEALVTKAIAWLKECHIDMTGSKKKVHTEVNKHQKKRQRKNKHKDAIDKGKKPPMKTAIDVVKRILWDEALEQDQFIVGYMDRMTGLKEKYFNAFSWEDIASVDYTVLAIPKHRIQYFKYKDVIVWDKRCRLDNVFGSTGSKTTIKDVIAKLNGAVNDEGNGQGGAQGNSGAYHRADNIDDHEDSDYCDSGEFSDSDSDDGISVTIDGGGAVGGANTVSGRGYSMGADSDDDGNAHIDPDTDPDAYNKYWRDKLRPNYFLALRITDENIRKKAVEIQDQVVAKEPRLKDCRIPEGAMHLTLCTVGLDTDQQIEDAVTCLKEAHSELCDIIPKDKTLNFKGVSTFFNRVIYGRVIDCPPEFFEFTEHLRACLSSKGIEIRDYHDFVPHMTLMKVSRPVAKITGNNYIAPWLYSSFNETMLGSQVVDNLHLCSMSDDRQPDGFYITKASLDI